MTLGRSSSSCGSVECIRLCFLFFLPTFCRYFRLCLAHQTAQQPIEALASCRKAIEACTLCVQHLKAQIGDTGAGAGVSREPVPGSDAPQGPESTDGAATEPAEAPKASEATESSAEAATGAGAASHNASIGEASSSAASEPGAAAKRREEALKELEEVEAVVGDLKEKVRGPFRKRPPPTRSQSCGASEIRLPCLATQATSA